MSSVNGGDMAWVGKRPARRLGGMADVLTMAAVLGFPVLVCSSINAAASFEISALELDVVIFTYNVHTLRCCRLLAARRMTGSWADYLWKVV